MRLSLLTKVISLRKREEQERSRERKNQITRSRQKRPVVVRLWEGVKGGGKLSTAGEDISGRRVKVKKRSEGETSIIWSESPTSYKRGGSKGKGRKGD